MIRVLYFARLREALGLSQEELDLNEPPDLPGNEITVADLMRQLAARGEVWHQEFDGCRPLRAALNQTLVANDSKIKSGDEVAFFPPVTGG